MTDVEIQLADHEARLKAVEEGNRLIFGKLDSVLSILAELRAKAEYAHTPQTCELRGAVEFLKTQVHELTAKVEPLTAALNRAQGGSSVILWLIGGGAMAIGALISWIVTKQ